MARTRGEGIHPTRYAPFLVQTCRFPTAFFSRHSREHHISPHFGQHGKLDPRFPHVAHAVCTRNIDARSSFSKTGCSASDLRQTGAGLSPSPTPVPTPDGSVVMVCTGVGGPADEGAVGK